MFSVYIINLYYVRIITKLPHKIMFTKYDSIKDVKQTFLRILFTFY